MLNIYKNKASDMSKTEEKQGWSLRKADVEECFWHHNRSVLFNQASLRNEDSNGLTM